MGSRAHPGRALVRCRVAGFWGQGCGFPVEMVVQDQRALGFGVRGFGVNPGPDFQSLGWVAKGFFRHLPTKAGLKSFRDERVVEEPENLI